MKIKQGTKQGKKKFEQYHQSTQQGKKKEPKILHGQKFKGIKFIKHDYL